MASVKHLVLLLLLYIIFASSIRYISASYESKATCNLYSNTFIRDLQLQCPLPISSSPPIQLKVDGESLDRALSSSQMNVYTAVLFYASWCPFSSGILPKFAFLGSMYPQIKHMMVEESSALPSVFSRYGIHSLPSILIANRTAKVRYHGPKDLSSIAQFYKKATGLEPVVGLAEVESSYSQDSHIILQPWNATSLKELFRKEPYLVLSVFFLFLKAFLYLFPEILSRLTAMWIAYIPHLNLEIFGESRQLLGRVLHLIDVKRVWSKLKNCKTRNLHRGARSAQVWASSIASVSLGETSSARASP